MTSKFTTQVTTVSIFFLTTRQKIQEEMHQVTGEHHPLLIPAPKGNHYKFCYFCALPE